MQCNAMQLSAPRAQHRVLGAVFGERDPLDGDEPYGSDDRGFASRSAHFMFMIASARKGNALLLARCQTRRQAHQRQ